MVPNIVTMTHLERAAVSMTHSVAWMTPLAVAVALMIGNFFVAE